MSSLETYGLQALGVDATHDLNTALILAVKRCYKDDEIERGFIELNSIILELYQKLEAIHEGRSTKFRMFSGLEKFKAERDALTKEVFEILKKSGWKYNSVLTESLLMIRAR
jgi:hypothetical protein